MIAKRRRTSRWPIRAALTFASLALAIPADARSEPGAQLVKLPGRPAADLALLRIWTCTNLAMESALGVSADGRWLSYANPDTGELMVRDLFKRGDQCVVKVPPSEVWHRMARGSLVSPDGSKIAYVWVRIGDPIQLRVIDRDGKRDRLLYQDTAVSWLAPACWSADSSQVVAVVQMEKARPAPIQILLLSVRGGSVRMLKSLLSDYPGGVSLDPTGRFLAYDTQPQSTASEREIRLLSLRSGEETVLLGGAADHRCLGWSPDGRKLLFASNRRSTTDCWVQRVEDGKPQGDPILLKQNLGTVNPLGITRSGGLYYSLDGNSTEVQIAKLDLASGEFVSKPKSLTGKDRGHDSEPHWSPDGKHLAYISERHDLRVICVRSMDTGEERVYSPSIGAFHTPVWSADSKSIQLTTMNQDPGKFRLDLGSGEAQRMRPDEASSFQFINQTCTFRRDLEQRRILAKHLETGQEKVLYQGGENEVLGGLQISPDRQQVAFMSNLGEGGVWRRMVKLVSADGGEVRELIGGTNYLAGFAWFPDSRQILCCADQQTWLIPTEGQLPRKLKAYVFGYNLRIHPDGQQLAYVKWDFRSELWLMENAVPSSGGVKEAIIAR